MNALRRSLFDSTMTALALTAAALFAALLVRDYLAEDTSLLFLLAVWLSAWLCGRAGGLTSTGASAIAILYFFLRPDPAATAPSWYVLTRLMVFVLMASLVTLATASWREGRRLFVSTLSGIGDAVLVTNREGRVLFFNPMAETLTGWLSAEAKGKPASDVLHLVHDKTREPAPSPIERVLKEGGAAVMESEAVMLSRNGTVVPIELSSSPIRDGSGKLRGAVFIFHDISKRRHMEEQATQAQKMDAVSRVSGEVAGDFNNVLTVIGGYANLLRNEMPAANPLRKFVDEIAYASDRAAALTRHLLAFSRGTTAQPKILDLNSLVVELEPMLRRLLGQDIEFVLLSSPGLGRVKTDPAHIEQIMVNLATNARDAMPDGGKLVVETANVVLDSSSGGKSPGINPGEYVMLAVSDTGQGMDPETRSRAFEPFFTTKIPGKGAGLGLATVYGLIKQSEGHITVYSQPGCGTIFEIYLPRVGETTEEPPAPKRPAKGSETLLLVDDEEGVRTLIAAVLKSNGYTVLEAANGAAALSVYDKNAHKVDLVLTDVVMPQMNGFELGRQLAGRTPGPKMLYMSGYRDTAVGLANGELPSAFLLKPFAPDTLLDKIREVLDAARAAE